MVQLIGETCLGLVLAPLLIGALLFLRLIIKDTLGLFGIIKPPVVED